MKYKKWVDPLLFSISFLVLYFAFVLAMLLFGDFPNGSYAPAAMAVLFALAWLGLALPIHCIKYSKTIAQEQFAPLFCVYHVLVLGALHVLPFNLTGEGWIVALFAVWDIIWLVTPLAVRTVKRRRAEKGAAEQTDVPPEQEKNQ